MTAFSDEATGIGWHDNLIYSLQFDVGDPAAGEWRADLVLDIDHITQWVCGTDGMFQVAPATLTFHHVADLRISLDFGGRDYPHTLPSSPSIAEPGGTRQDAPLALANRPQPA